MGIDRESRATRNSKDRYSELARLLRRRREELGLSRRDVVASTKLSYPYVSQLEGGYRAPSVGSARKLADALHLPVEDVVRAAGGEVSESQPSAPSARRPARAGEFRNPAYSAGIMHDVGSGPAPAESGASGAGSAAAAAHAGAADAWSDSADARFAVGSAVPAGLAALRAPGEKGDWASTRSRTGESGSTASRGHTGESDWAASRDRTGESDLEAVADTVGRVLRQLPPESRLDALALAQSRLMAEMVQEQVRRATEG